MNGISLKVASHAAVVAALLLCLSSPASCDREEIMQEKCYKENEDGVYDCTHSFSTIISKIPSNARIIDLSHNFDLHQIKKDAWENLDNLKTLIMSYTLYDAFDFTFEHLTSLTELYLNRSDLLDLHANGFKPLTSLRILDLSNVAIGTVSVDSFAGLSNLESLMMRGWRFIKNLPQGVFNPLSNLQMLSLEASVVPTYPKGLFEGPRNTLQLTLNFAAGEIQSFAFKGLNMKTLQVPGNVSSIGKHAFSGITGLQTLDIANSKIEHLPEYAFSGLHDLNVLSFIGSRVESIAGGAFRGTSLEKLDFSHSALSSISAESFDGLTSLKSLVLLDTKLQSIPSGAFSSTPNLRNLKIVFNQQLQSVAANAFNGIEDITYLKITKNNKLQSFDDSTFSGVSGSVLSIRYNDNLVSINNNAFNGAHFTNIAIVQNRRLSNIATNAFRGVIVRNNLNMKRNAIPQRVSSAIEKKGIDVLRWRF